MKTIKNTALAVGVGAFALFSSVVQAASVGDVVFFDFTGPARSTSLVDNGNRFGFADSSGEFSLTAAAYARTSAGLQQEVLVQAESDYSRYGYKVDDGLSGLGVCSDADVKKNLGKCLSNSDNFAVDGDSASEWVLMTLPENLIFTAIELSPVDKSDGQVEIYSANLSAGVLGSTVLATQYTYGRKSGPQTFDLASVLNPAAGNSILVGAETRSTRYVVTGVRAQVVPVPAASWLMISGLVVLYGARRRRANAAVA